MRTPILAVLLSFFTMAGQAFAQTEAKAIAYGDKPRNTLDLYMPDGVKNPPLLIFIHGGRWFRNDRTQVSLYGRVEALLQAGIAIASLDYTYSTDEIWPAQINDVEKALAFLRENADQYGYDGQKIAVWGQSSGAHLALWVGALSAKDPETMLDAVVSWYAPSSLYDLAGDHAADGLSDTPVQHQSERQVSGSRGNDTLSVSPEGSRQNSAAHSPDMLPESILIGKDVSAHKAAADAASPEIYIANLPKGQKLPNFLLMTGTMDKVVSPRQTKRLFDTLKKQGGAEQVELVWVEGAGHGGDLFTPHVPQVVDFLMRQFTRKADH